MRFSVASAASASASGVAPASPVGVVLDDALQADQLGAVVERDQRHALRRAAELADLGDAGAHQHAVVGDQHDLVVGPHQRGGDDLAVALALLDRDHALGAAAVARVLDDARCACRSRSRWRSARSASRPRRPASRSRSGRRRASCRARRARCGPSARTSSSSKRTALPPSLNSITSCWPSVSAAPIR